MKSQNFRGSFNDRFLWYCRGFGGEAPARVVSRRATGVRELGCATDLARKQVGVFPPGRTSDNERRAQAVLSNTARKGCPSRQSIHVGAAVALWKDDGVAGLLQ